MMVNGVWSMVNRQFTSIEEYFEPNSLFTFPIWCQVQFIILDSQSYPQAVSPEQEAVNNFLQHYFKI